MGKASWWGTTKRESRLESDHYLINSDKWSENWKSAVSTFASFPIYPWAKMLGNFACILLYR